MNEEIRRSIEDLRSMCSSVLNSEGEDVEGATRSFVNAMRKCESAMMSETTEDAADDDVYEVQSQGWAPLGWLIQSDPSKLGI